MSKNVHDYTFKKLMNNRDFFIDLCKAYLPEEIKSRLNWETMKPYKMNTEFIEESTAKNKQRERHADIVYSVQYDDCKRACLLCLHIEHQLEPDKFITIRFLNYNSSLLVEYAENNPKKKLPVIVNILYYQGKVSPYPHSLDIYDLFTDRDLAQRYLLHPLLVDLNQLPEAELAKHGAIFPMEALFKLSLKTALKSNDYELFLKAIVQQKDNKFVIEYLNVMLRYAATAWDCNYDDFATRFIETLPDLEDTMLTMAQQLEQRGEVRGERRGERRGEKRGIQKGRQEGMQDMARTVALNMLKRNMSIEDIAEISGLSSIEVGALAGRPEKSE